MNLDVSQKMTRASVRPVQDMILEVLDDHPQGLMLVPLHTEVDAELVRQRIWLDGCNYDQVRYSLRWLIDNDFILAKPTDARGNHYTYHIKSDAAVRTQARTPKNAAKPDRKLSPMAFALHALSQIPTTWDRKKDERQRKSDSGAEPTGWPGIGGCKA